MVGCVIRSDELQRVPGEGVSAMVINCLDCGKGEEARSLSNRHTREFKANASTKCVEQESFQGVVVQSTVGVWNVESVVSGVESRYEKCQPGLPLSSRLGAVPENEELTVHPSIHMHQAMQKVLP